MRFLLVIIAIISISLVGCNDEIALSSSPEAKSTTSQPPASTADQKNGDFGCPENELW